MNTSMDERARRSALDVAVIGAGAAGIAAARRVCGQGLNVGVFEAADRIGGRAHTERDSLGVRFDRGAAWFHCASRNPLRAHADGFGLCYAGDPTMRYHAGGRWLIGDEAYEVERHWQAANEALRLAGQRGEDVAAASLLDPQHRHAPLRDYLLSAIRAVAPADFATAEAAAEEDTGEDWVALDGLGALIERLGQDLPVTTAAPVRRIARHTESVQIDTDAEAIHAAAAIVTVSSGVLASDAIAFDPPLPQDKRAALTAVPMGRAEKIALRFAPDPFGMPPNTFVTIEREGTAMGFHLLPGDAVLAVGYGGAEQAEAIARGSEREVVDWAMGYLEHAFGVHVRGHLVAATRTAWMDDAGVRGAYSAARPGAHGARDQLADPVGGRLFFAGEATHPSQFASVHGAWHSGERAAAEALTMLRQRAARTGGPG